MKNPMRLINASGLAAGAIQLVVNGRRLRPSWGLRGTPIDPVSPKEVS